MTDDAPNDDGSPDDHDDKYARDMFIILTCPRADATPQQLAQWWDLRAPFESGIGGLTPCTVEVIDPPEGGINHGYDAEVFLKQRSVAGGPILAVLCGGSYDVEPAAVGKDLAALTRHAARHAALREKALAGIKGTKAANIGCTACGSKIARKFLKDCACPVCAGGLLKEQAQRRIDAAAALAAKLFDAVRSHRGPHSPKRRTGPHYELGGRLVGPVVDPFAFYKLPPGGPAAGTADPPDTTEDPE